MELDEMLIFTGVMWVGLIFGKLQDSWVGVIFVGLCFPAGILAGILFSMWLRNR